MNGSESLNPGPPKDYQKCGDTNNSTMTPFICKLTVVYAVIQYQKMKSFLFNFYEILLNKSFEKVA